MEDLKERIKGLEAEAKEFEKKFLKLDDDLHKLFESQGKYPQCSVWNTTSWREFVQYAFGDMMMDLGELESGEAITKEEYKEKKYEK